MVLKHSQMRNVPLLFCVNKQDLPNAKQPAEIEKVFDLKEVRTSRAFKMQSLAAITGYVSVVVGRE